MKVNGTNKMLVVCLLVAIFLMPVVAQLAHALHNNDCSAGCSHTEKKEHHHHHDCKTCAVCKFTFSQFVESDISHPFTLLTRFLHTESVTIREAACGAFPVTNHLRGPPSL